MKNENKLIYITLIALSAIFFTFGYHHISKFETTDEQLWKYGRIKNYWQAIGNHDWKKTYVNDKPGITVALFSGLGLLFDPGPETHQISDPKITQSGLFFLYDISRSEYINLVFRLPILIISTLSLFLFFWLIKRATDSSQLAIFSVMFISLNPILIGMSQIINPDSFLWIFGGLSIFSYFARLKTNENKFLVLAGLFAGLALLSKYTAFTLFLFFILALLSKLIFDQKYNEKVSKEPKVIFREILSIFLIFLIAIITFSVLLPAVFINPEYLFKGLSQFIKWKNFLVAATFSLLILTTFYIKKGLLQSLIKKLYEKKNIILVISTILFLLLTVPVFLNVWTEQKFIPFDQLRDSAYANEPKEFNFGHILDGDNIIEKNIKLLLMEVYPFIFSFTPIAILLLLFLIIKSLQQKNSSLESFIFFPIITYSIIYFIATVLAEVVSNVRYVILLYPLFAFLSAIAFWKFISDLKLNSRKMLALLSLIVVFSIYTPWSIRPFYFSYANNLLPKKFSIHQSWGHGAYEAAQYLNSLPSAENMVIWSNSSTICLFFEGKCLGTRKIDLNRVKPDYFVMSKRGELKVKKRFIFTNPDFSGRDSSYYFEKMKTDPDWEILIDGRPENYVRVIKFEN